MPSLEVIARNSSSWLWNELLEALNMRMILHETGCTDFLLKRIQREAGTQIIVETITDESKIGADWEWWFMTPTGYALPLRVQAKVMFMDPKDPVNHASNPLYKQIHYRRRGRSQTNTLIRRAAADGMFPLYCLYTNFNGNFEMSHPGCTCSSYVIDKSLFGISLVGAEAVRVRSGKNLSHFIDEIHALPCLFRELGWLSGLEQYLFSHWPETGQALKTGYDRRNREIRGSGQGRFNELDVDWQGQPLPEIVTLNAPLTREFDACPAYVQRLFQITLERQTTLANALALQVQGQFYWEAQRKLSDDAEHPWVLPKGTGRVTLFLLPEAQGLPL